MCISAFRRIMTPFSHLSDSQGWHIKRWFVYEWHLPKGIHLVCVWITSWGVWKYFSATQDVQSLHYRATLWSGATCIPRTVLGNGKCSSDQQDVCPDLINKRVFLVWSVFPQVPPYPPLVVRNLWQKHEQWVFQSERVVRKWWLRRHMTRVKPI